MLLQAVPLGMVGCHSSLSSKWKGATAGQALIRLTLEQLHSELQLLWANQAAAAAVLCVTLLLLAPAAHAGVRQLAHTCDHTEVCLGLKGVKHLDDVLMPQLPQDLDLLPQVPDVLF
jgi:hypothetical protein